MLLSRKLIVFGSNSLALVEKSLLARIELRSPVMRGDLELLAKEPPATALILDGVFGSSLAVTPTECRHLLEAGWLLAGAASIGALRASELWSIGMLGFGDIFNLFRIGLLRSDADVAVALNASTFQEITLSIVHIRCILSATEGKNLISGTLARRMLMSARSIFWADRVWLECKTAWQQIGVSTEALDYIELSLKNPLMHPKARDGKLAVDTLLARRWVPLNELILRYES